MQSIRRRRESATYLLGVRIDGLRLPELLDRVVRSVETGRKETILYVNAHCMNVQHRDPAYRAILADVDTVYCDGMGVALAARMTGQTIPQRMTGADWIEDLCRLAAARNLSLYLLGGTSEAVHGAAAALRRRHSGLQIVGEHDGYDVGPDLVNEINELHPDIVLVGMGVPRQEKWIVRNRSQLDTPVVWAVGGLFDFVSGRVPRGPKWMTEHGLEWLCRLVAEPRRLWRRYLLGNPRFLWHVLVTHATVPADRPGVLPGTAAPPP